MLTDEFLNTFKRQNQYLKEQLDIKTTQNKDLHAKQEELRAYARELKERAESLYTAKGDPMP
jgi:predicted nuclease with TOPRIM domain